jgi:archaellum component FlaF (FlaF/FlaG flagellin family)
MKAAQSQFVLALKMRSDAVSRIAQEIQPALATPTAGDAVAVIAGQMSRLYASDVIYNDYAAPAIAAALRSAGIPAGGLQGQPIVHGHFVPNTQWLASSYLAVKLGNVSAAKKNAKAAPGIHGHRMVSVDANGVPLQTATTNSVAANPPPTFTCTFDNDGQNTETNVVVKVTVNGTSVSGQAIVPRTVPNQSYTAHVTLSSSPPTGNYTVTATIERVPGETVTTHNTQSFPVAFH